MNEEIIPTDKKIKVKRDKINQKTIDRLNRMHEEVMSSAVEVAKKAIALGEELLATKKLVKYGTWEIWVEENLSYDLRTAQRYMKAAKRKGELLTDPVGFMAQLYGNSEPIEDKQVKGNKNDVDVASDEGGEEDEDEDESGTSEKQHGGEGPNFADKKNFGFQGFRAVAIQLDQQLFLLATIPVDEKLAFIEELQAWLEEKKTILLGEENAPENEEL